MSSTKLSRRGLIGGLALSACSAAAGPLSRPAEAAEPAPTALVFGDSYSIPVRRGVANWSQQLADQGALRVVANLARGGASAARASGPKSLAGQVAAWLERRQAAPDFTIIYMGNNDILGVESLATAKNSYRAAVDRLIAAGANAGAKRLVLVQIHDIGRNPAVTTDVRRKVSELNGFVRFVVGSRPNLRTVNLGLFFDRVFASPGAFGLTNITTPDPANSAGTALFFDDFHFGLRGQQLVAGEVRRVLAGG